MRIDGSCHCGAITYSADIDPAEVSVCHCTDCQKLTGTVYRVTVSVPISEFHLTGGEPTLYVKTAGNGRKRLQYFCGTCGSPIYTIGEGDAANIVGIRAGTIKQFPQLEPRSQIWCSSALPWLGEVEALPGRDGD
ncbi:GFA family protein [Sinorhizobium meliloti]|uniref:GFA family protein n=1 Tax=Rhizobium meliloti TaxID=382 RepID=UPI000FD8F1E9|nr:GFA family protein [Sinorhizobium meliloti]RVI93582.1 GFA family protein [Sinorhizobium meliloti]